MTNQIHSAQNETSISSIFNLYIFIIALISLTACQTHYGTSSKTIYGENLGKREWKDISESESKITVLKRSEIINKRQANFLPSRYQERFYFDDGVLFYENAYRGNFRFISRFDRFEILNKSKYMRSRGYRIQKDEVRSKEFNKFTLNYAIRKNDSYACIVSWATIGLAGDSDRYFDYINCRSPLLHNDAETLEEDSFEFISGLRFN